MDIKQIQEIIEKSGNNFHYKVVEFLRDNNWYVVVSPYYNDNFTDKPREIDIIAEKEFAVNDLFDNWIGTINVRFFIECKYITANTVFWFDKKNIQGAMEKVIVSTPLKKDNLILSNETHHYLEIIEVAKLFSSENNKNPDGEFMHKAITQSLNSMVYYKDKSSFIPKNPRKPSKILTYLNYPLILCNNFNNFWKYSVVEKSRSEQIKDNFQLEVQYAYFDKDKNNKNEYFLLDVLSIDNFENFINNLEKNDIKTIKDALSFDALKNKR